MSLAAEYDVFSQEAVRQMLLRLQGQLVRTGLYLFDEYGELIHQSTVDLLLGKKDITIYFDLDTSVPFHSFRWDPIEGSPCRVSTQSIVLTNHLGVTTSISIDEMQHHGELENDGICFYTNDPQQKYFFSGNAKRIEITARVEKLDAFIAEQKLSERVFALQDQNRRYASYSLELEELRGELELRLLEEQGRLQESREAMALQQEQLSAQEQYIGTLLNSWSWKLTRPLRWLTGFYREQNT